MTTMPTYHNPVMLDECMDALNIRNDGIYVDVTYGGGGHSKAILNRLESGRLFAFDQDEDSMGEIIGDERLVHIRQNFRFLSNFLKMHDAIPVDGLLADLGISSHQIDTPERGFTFRDNGPLDMRMDKGQQLTAARVVNEYDEADLIRIFRQYGELTNAGKIARLVGSYRKEHAIETSEDLLEAIKSVTPFKTPHKFLAKVFQALRIEVNGELDALKAMLSQCEEVVKAKGRIAIITYHSLEDRLVKNYIRSGNFEGDLEKDFYGNVIKPFDAVNRKPITATEEEITRNNRARSAKLRIAEKRTVH